MLDGASPLRGTLKDLPASLHARIRFVSDWKQSGPYAGALVEGDASQIRAANQAIAALSGPLVLTQAASSEELSTNADSYCLNWLMEEVSTSINTTAAGGNASLMAIG